MKFAIIFLIFALVTYASGNPLQDDQQDQASSRLSENGDKAKNYFFDIINKNVMRANGFVEDTKKYNICWWTVVLYMGKWECGVFTIAEAKVALPDFDSKRQFYKITDLDSSDKESS